MGILSIFSRDPGQRVQALRKKIQERYGQPEGRQQAMDKLLDMGTPEAIAALLTRFTVNVEPSITDAEEKEYLFKSLVDMGEKAVDPIQAFLLRSDDAASWALRLLDQLIAPEALVAFCIEALRKIGPDYTRDPEKKLVLISTLAKREGDSRRLSVKHLIAQLEQDDPKVSKNLFNAVHTVQLDTLVGWKHKGVEHDFRENLED